MIIGSILGLASGALQFWLLSLFSKSVTSGVLSKKTALLGVLQFLLPLAVLLLCALLLRDSLLWAAIGMVAALTISALLHFFLSKKQWGNRR